MRLVAAPGPTLRLRGVADGCQTPERLAARQLVVHLRRPRATLRQQVLRMLTGEECAGAALDDGHQLDGRRRQQQPRERSVEQTLITRHRDITADTSLSLALLM